MRYLDLKVSKEWGTSVVTPSEIFFFFFGINQYWVWDWGRKWEYYYSPKQ